MDGRHHCTTVSQCMQLVAVQGSAGMKYNFAFPIPGPRQLTGHLSDLAIRHAKPYQTGIQMGLRYLRNSVHSLGQRMGLASRSDTISRNNLSDVIVRAAELKRQSGSQSARPDDSNLGLERHCRRIAGNR